MNIPSLPDALANGRGGSLQMYVGGVSSKVVAMPRVYRDMGTMAGQSTRLGGSQPHYGIPMHAALFGVRPTNPSGRSGGKPLSQQQQPLCSAGKLMVVASLAQFSTGIVRDRAKTFDEQLPGILEILDRDPFPYAGQSRGEIDGSFDALNKHPTSAPETQDDLACQVRGLANIYNHTTTRFNQGQLVGWDYLTMLRNNYNEVDRAEGFLVPPLALANDGVASKMRKQKELALATAQANALLVSLYSDAAAGTAVSAGSNVLALAFPAAAAAAAAGGSLAESASIADAISEAQKLLNVSQTAEKENDGKNSYRIRVIGIVTKSGGPGEWVGVHLYGGSI